MPNIRYVCLSDPHLGEEDSLLTEIDRSGQTDTESPSPVLLRLADCLAELLRHNDASAPKPTLILNGDILELALATENEAALTFGHFISRLMPPGAPLFGEIVYIPGNHDHHLWETARVQQYLNHIRRLPEGKELEPPWHTTKLFMDMRGKDRLASDFLTTVAARFGGLRGLEILTAYPNYGIRDDNGRCIVFHHGHFIEPLYRLMSTIATLLRPDRDPPAVVYDLEAENFAWIDFFWSAMGRQAQVGPVIEDVYKATYDRESLLALVNTLARNIARRYDIPWLWGDLMEELVLRFVFRQVVNRVAGKLERQRTDQSETLPLSADAREGLADYMQLLWEQASREESPLPDAATFVLGHTHKPFQVPWEFAGYPQPVPVLNTGGWIVESIEPEPLRGGAVALIDEELNAVNLRMYNEGRYEVRVEEPVPPEAPRSALWEHVNGIARSDCEPWRGFGRTVAVEVARRAEFLKARRGGPG
jgi:UDP-2,3-diacylglucosamine pyrophosphatase LpxH